jgi:hypothetical protein
VAALGRPLAEDEWERDLSGFPGASVFHLALDVVQHSCVVTVWLVVIHDGASFQADWWQPEAPCRGEQDKGMLRAPGTGDYSLLTHRSRP